MSASSDDTRNSLGFTVGCIHIGRRVKICLECGWLSW